MLLLVTAVSFVCGIRSMERSDMARHATRALSSYATGRYARGTAADAAANTIASGVPFNVPRCCVVASWSVYLLRGKN